MKNVPKNKWADGPWKNEPDCGFVNVDGIPCFAIRNMTTGCWGGYIGVPIIIEKLKILKSSISKEIRYQDNGKQFRKDNIHNNKQFQEVINKSGIHLEDYCWIGFRCEDIDDIAPGIDAISENIENDSKYKKKFEELKQTIKKLKIDRSYKDINFVKEEIIKLARAVKAAMEQENGNNTEPRVH